MGETSRILLIDDDETVNFLNALVLAKAGVTCDVRTTSQGLQGLAWLSQVPTVPTLVLLDLDMPALDGVEFMRLYRLLPAAVREATVVLILTPDVHLRTLERLRGLPVAGALEKPLTREKVRHLLEQHFSVALPAS